MQQLLFGGMSVYVYTLCSFGLESSCSLGAHIKKIKFELAAHVAVEVGLEGVIRSAVSSLR